MCKRIFEWEFVCSFSILNKKNSIDSIELSNNNSISNETYDVDNTHMICMLDKVRQRKVCNIRRLALKFSVVQTVCHKANGLLNLFFTTIKYYEATNIQYFSFLAYNINIIHR